MFFSLFFVFLVFCVMKGVVLFSVGADPCAKSKLESFYGFGFLLLVG